MQEAEFRSELTRSHSSLRLSLFTAVTAAVHCLSKDFDDETAELGLAALRELKKHSVSECDPIEEEVSDDSDVTTDEDLEEAYVEDQEDTRPVIKQRRRTISHKTPRAICKAINVSLISDIIETIATAGTKDEVFCCGLFARQSLTFDARAVFPKLLDGTWQSANRCQLTPVDLLQPANRCQLTLIEL